MLPSLFGWFGTICILLAFFLLTHRTVHSHSKTYLGLNLVGGAALAVETYTFRSFAAFTLNIAWVLVSLYGLYRMKQKKR